MSFLSGSALLRAPATSLLPRTLRAPLAAVYDGERNSPPVLPLLPEANQERLSLVRMLTAIASVRTIDDLKLRTQQALAMYLPCEHFIFASGRIRAHRAFVYNLIHTDAMSEQCLGEIVGNEGMVPPLDIDLAEHYGRPKFTTTSEMKTPTERIWADIFRRHGIANVAWMVLPGLQRNTFTGYYFINATADISHENKLRMTVLAPYLHIALNRVRGSKQLREQQNDRGSPQASSLLSSRETEIARWVVRGKTNWEIGQILGISDKTVKTHMQNILSKLHASSRAQIAALFSDE
ncbi:MULTISPECIES: LuxR C-terminal-related transcriptional regulator [unclassified Pseudomonas]|uniref:LuxR C-terminal-related transcriptional regulator n=1 Tax=unclassified Pseudomonas TaxID=196821 RepID=UPI00244A702E|nr:MULTISPECIES: LuxR C-terminal-related transcriptional regulator [unclassified Pseudomonas]MDG9923692.1 LuxR C-terminal-related transcriptional regulator [Pseudomonas sp. GD04045]MDH0036454.1 LuxR C-terminal-related transcriptional regulator [Pseudomonas sp. GD04019]